MYVSMKKKNNTVIYLKHISRTKQSSIGTILIIPRPSSTQNLKVKYVILRSKSTTFSILFHEEKQNKVKRFFKKTATQIKLYSIFHLFSKSWNAGMEQVFGHCSQNLWQISTRLFPHFLRYLMCFSHMVIYVRFSRKLFLTYRTGRHINCFFSMNQVVVSSGALHCWQCFATGRTLNHTICHWNESNLFKS